MTLLFFEYYFLEDEFRRISSMWKTSVNSIAQYVLSEIRPTKKNERKYSFEGINTVQKFLRFNYFRRFVLFRSEKKISIFDLTNPSGKMKKITNHHEQLSILLLSFLIFRFKHPVLVFKFHNFRFNFFVISFDRLVFSFEFLVLSFGFLVFSFKFSVLSFGFLIFDSQFC